MEKRRDGARTGQVSLRHCSSRAQQTRQAPNCQSRSPKCRGNPCMQTLGTRSIRRSRERALMRFRILPFLPFPLVYLLSLIPFLLSLLSPSSPPPSLESVCPSSLSFQSTPLLHPSPLLFSLSSPSPPPPPLPLNLPCPLPLFLLPFACTPPPPQVAPRWECHSGANVNIENCAGTETKASLSAILLRIARRRG